MDSHTLTRPIRFGAGDAGEVSALLTCPENARGALVYGHGAGADMRHAFHEGMAGALARRRIATFRYNFPYTEAGRRRPDRTAVLIRTVRTAVETAAVETCGLSLVAGGKSMGGRMTSSAASEKPLAGVCGLVFFGFPLHRPGEKSAARADHLAAVDLPLLFLQGTRDRLADISLMETVCRGLGERASLHILADADHSFHVPKRTGRTPDDVRDELATAVEAWWDGLGL